MEFDTGDEDLARDLGTVIAPTTAIALVPVAPRLVRRRRLVNPILFVPPNFDVAVSS